MRAARRADAWRHTADWKTRPAIIAFEAGDVDGFSPGLIQLPGGLALLCGVNSVGKTRLLASLYKSLKVSLSPDGTAPSMNMQVSTPPPSGVHFVDPFWLVQRQRVSIGRDANVQDRLDQAGLTDLRPLDLQMASFLLGRDYSSIRISELEATDDELVLEDFVGEVGTLKAALEFRPDVIPYFEVDRYGVTYASPKLSQGELAGLTLIWVLGQLEFGTITLIDEPENFLSPDAARRVLDVVAHYADKRGSQCLVASHSHLGLVEAPIDRILLFLPLPSGETEIQPADPSSLWSSLRLRPPHSIILLVEDQAASEWLIQLLRLVEFPHADSTAVWVAHGAGEVRTAAAFPQCEETADIAIWGVLDGDERSTPHQGRLLFLPGTLPPESLMLEAASQMSGQDFSLSEQAYQTAVRVGEGTDIHERIDQIAHDLGLTVSAFRAQALAGWLRTDAGGVALEQFKADLTVIRPVFPRKWTREVPVP